MILLFVDAMLYPCLIEVHRYWNEPYFNALSAIQKVAEKHGLTLNEIALRWISHHSMLKREYGDAILIGASNLKHIEEVCVKSCWLWLVLLVQFLF